MQGIYTYIPDTNYVPREYSVAAVLLLLFMVLISLVSVLNLLYVYISTFRSMCAVPNMAVFCSSLTSCFPGRLLTYFLNDFEIVPIAPIITIIIKRRVSRLHSLFTTTTTNHKNNKQLVWNVKTKVIPVIIGATGSISKSFRKYLSNIPGKHEVKELQKTVILGTAHILRKVLM